MSSRTPASRVVLLHDPLADRGPLGSKVRRYRLARLRLVERRDEHPARLAHLARTYD